MNANGRIRRGSPTARQAIIRHLLARQLEDRFHHHRDGKLYIYVMNATQHQTRLITAQPKYTNSQLDWQALSRLHRHAPIPRLRGVLLRHTISISKPRTPTPIMITG